MFGELEVGVDVFALATDGAGGGGALGLALEQAEAGVLDHRAGLLLDVALELGGVLERLEALGHEALEETAVLGGHLRGGAEGADDGIARGVDAAVDEA